MINRPFRFNSYFGDEEIPDSSWSKASSCQDGGKRREEIEERDIKVKLLGDLTTGWAGLGVFSSFPT